MLHATEDSNPVLLKAMGDCYLLTAAFPLAPVDQLLQSLHFFNANTNFDMI